MSKAISLSPEKKMFSLDNPFMKWDETYIYIWIDVCVYIYISPRNKFLLIIQETKEQIVGFFLTESEIYTYLICNQSVSFNKDRRPHYYITYLNTKDK